MGERMSLFIAQTERLKTWIGLAALVITNIVGISAHYKPETETTAHASYKELASAVQNISKENIKLSNDLANLRGYVSGMNNKPLQELTANIGSGSGTGAGYGVGGGARRISRSVASVPVHSAPPPMPPPMTAAPREYHPPTIEALTKE